MIVVCYIVRSFFFVLAETFLDTVFFHVPGAYSTIRIKCDSMPFLMLLVLSFNCKETIVLEDPFVSICLYVILGAQRPHHQVQAHSVWYHLAIY